MKRYLDLSKREVEILSLIGTGINTKEIAEKLYISADTVNCHRKNILRKSGTQNIMPVLVLAVKKNLIKTDLTSIYDLRLIS